MDAHPSAPAPADEPRPGGPEERPPVLGSWRAVYGVVIGELLLVITFCHWLSGWGR